MKKFSVPCDFNGVKSPVTIYIGYPKSDHHPIHFQSNWLSKDRGGTVPPEVMDSLSKLRDLSDQNGIPFEDLCVYALGAAQQDQEEESSSEEEAPDVVEEDAEGSSGGGVSTVGDQSELEEDDEALKKKK